MAVSLLPRKKSGFETALDYTGKGLGAVAAGAGAVAPFLGPAAPIALGVAGAAGAGSIAAGVGASAKEAERSKPMMETSKNDDPFTQVQQAVYALPQLPVEVRKEYGAPIMNAYAAALQSKYGGQA